MAKSSAKKSAKRKVSNGARQAGKELLSQIKKLQKQLKETAQRRPMGEIINDLETSREYYANLYDFAPVGYVSLDRVGVVREINLKGAELLGGTRRRILGRPMIVRFKKDDQRRWLNFLVGMRQGDHAVVDMDLDHPEQRKVMRFYFSRIELMTEIPAAREAVYRAAMIDVTEERMAVDALREAKQAAEEANKSKDHFLAVLSHELRTPLSPVLTAVSMLDQDREMPRQFHEELTLIRRNVEMESRLIDDLLDVTRITRGKLELARRAVALGRVVRCAMEVCQPEAEAKGLVLHAEVEGDLAVVMGDEARLQQVFWNLLKNAIKFTPEGGRIEIRGAVEGERVRVEVSDTGPGIERGVLRRIFTPFEQGGEVTTKRYGGLGLGLAICRGVVEAHGGTISASSEGVGRGAKFVVELPVYVGVKAEELPEKSGSNGAAKPAMALKILLVEDHVDTAKVMRQLLTASGHQVESAGSVAAAIKTMMNGTRFQLIISDLGLPDGSGLDLMRELRKRGVLVPGIALSGYGQEEDVRRSKEAGFAVHLTKPADPERLMQVIGLVAAGVERERFHEFEPVAGG